MSKIFFGKGNLLFILVFIALVFGNILFFSASSVKSLKETGSLWTYWWDFFIKTTLLGLLVFFIGFYFGYTWPKRKPIVVFIFLLLFFTLLISLFLGSGPKRWIKLHYFSIQPSEIIKPFVLLFASSLVAGLENLFGFSIARLIVFWLPVFLVALLVFLQPALTNSLIIFLSAFVVYLALKPNWKEILIIFGLIILLIVSAFLWEYRVERFLAFLKPEASAEKSLQAKLAQQAVSSGGFWGRGLGSSVYKIVGIPEMLSDSIIAIIVEEIGLFGLLAILFFYGFLFIYSLNLASKIEVLEGRAFVYGVITWLTLQTIIHIAGNIGLMPLTGVVLPFFSQGGSAQLAILFSFGIIKGLYEKWS